jgi:hypothetical protein
LTLASRGELAPRGPAGRAAILLPSGKTPIPCRHDRAHWSTTANLLGTLMVRPRWIHQGLDQQGWEGGRLAVDLVEAGVRFYVEQAYAVDTYTQPLEAMYLVPWAEIEGLIDFLRGSRFGCLAKQSDVGFRR